MDSALSNLLLIDECLFDEKRVQTFARAIKKSVKVGDIVVDAGTGTGIIALLAAKAGAKKVYAVEWDPEIARVAVQNIRANNFHNTIEVVNADVREFRLPTGDHADVLVMEMLDTGFIAEQQAGAIIGLKKNGVIKTNTTILPERATFFMTALQYDFNFYGFNLPSIIQARNDGVLPRIKKVMSKDYCYADIDLQKLMSRQFSANVRLKVTQSGILNGIKLSTDIYLSGKVCHATTDMNMPIIIPIPPRQVKRGDMIPLSVEYVMGKGFRDFKIVA